MKRSLAIILTLILVLSSFTYAFAQVDVQNPDAEENPIESMEKDNGNSDDAPGQSKEEKNQDSQEEDKEKEDKEDKDKDDSGKDSEKSKEKKLQTTSISSDSTPQSSPSTGDESSERKNTKIHVHINSGSEYVSEVKIYLNDGTVLNAGGNDENDKFTKDDNGDYALNKINKIEVIKTDNSREEFTENEWTNSNEGSNGKGSLNIWIDVEGITLIDGSSLNLTSLCIENAKAETQTRWRVRNTTDKDIEFTYEAYGKGVTGTGTAVANDDTIIFVDVPHSVTLKIYWGDELQHNKTKASGGNLCDVEVAFSVIGGNGTISAEVDNNSIASGDYVYKGKTVDFTADPDSGYGVKEWKLNGAVVNGTSESLTVNDIQNDVNVTVEYMKHYEQQRWDMNGVSWSRSDDPFDGTNSGVLQSYGSIGDWYDGSLPTFTLNETPWQNHDDTNIGSIGHLNGNMTPDLEAALFNLKTGSNNTPELRLIQATFDLGPGEELNDGRIQAAFRDNGDIIPINDIMYVFVNGHPYFSGGTRNVDLGVDFLTEIGKGNQSGSEYEESDGWNINISSVPYIPSEWLVEGENEVQIFVEEFYGSGGLGKLVLQGNIKDKDYEVTLNVEPSESGTVSGDGTYNYDDNVNLEADPAEGYDFTGWRLNGDIVSTDEIYSFSMPAKDITLTAVFEEESGETGGGTTNPPNTGNTRNPELSISKIAVKDEVFIGEEAEFTIIVTNIGNTNLSGVKVKDDMTGLNTTVNLAEGESETFEVSVTAEEEGTIVNTASANGGGASFKQDSASVTVLPLEEIEDDDNPLGDPDTEKEEETKDESEKEEEVIEDKEEDIPQETPDTEEPDTEDIEEEQVPLDLPDTGVLPVELFYGLGVLISGAGVLVSKKK